MCIICVCNITEYIKYVKQGVNKRGGKAYSPQTDSVPSVDRAISCFNKHVFWDSGANYVISCIKFHCNCFRSFDVFRIQDMKQLLNESFGLASVRKKIVKINICQFIERPKYFYLLIF